MIRQLVIDGQVFQTPAYDRGMGKYSFELIESLVKVNDQEKKWSKIIVHLSSELAKTSPVTLEEIKKLLPKSVKTAMLDLDRNEFTSSRVAAKNRTELNEYIEQSIGLEVTVDYLMLSPMQGEICAVFPSLKNVHNSVLCYDLIPLMFWKIYLQNPLTANEYQSKLKELLRADMYLCISKTCANDLTLYLGIDKDRTVSINGGPIMHSTEEKDYHVKKPYFFMPTGNDLRKNNRNAIMAFKNFNEAHGNKYQLVVTSHFNDYEVSDYMKLCEDVVFTGNISGAEMNYLYRNSEALLFVPHYEGLGLPLLEAMIYNKPIVCSDISVFREITRDGVIYCNQNLPGEITAALEQTLEYTVDENIYKRVLKKFSWEDTGKNAYRAMHQAKKASQYNDHDRPSLVVHTASPEDCSQDLAMMVQYLAAELGRYYDVCYLVGEHIATVRKARMSYLSYITTDTPDFFGRHLYILDDSPDYKDSLRSALADDGTGMAILRTPSLSEAWSALRMSEQIDNTRYDLEKTLDDRLGGRGAMLSSLISTGIKFVVFDVATRSIIKKVAKQLDKPVEVRVLPIPHNPLPYKDVLPDKEEEIGIDMDYANTHGVAIPPYATRLKHTEDFRYFETISRCQKVQLSENGDTFLESIAQSLGAQTANKEQSASTYALKELAQTLMETKHDQ